jgi:CheY-like chemotaxis protein
MGKGRTVRVLIADDTASVRDALSFVLSGAGHEVVSVEDGARAMEAVGGAPFDLVILDIWMPKRSGLDVLKALRVDQPDLPVIIMSGGGPGASLEQATAIADLYQATRILYKPFEDEELLDAIQAICGSA